MKSFCVIRVPSSGPPALAGAPNVFDTLEAAQSRISEIELAQLKIHHTWLDIVEVDGPVLPALQARGIGV